MNKVFNDRIEEGCYMTVIKKVLPRLAKQATRNSGVLVTVEESVDQHGQALYTVISPRTQRGAMFSYKAKLIVLRDILSILDFRSKLKASDPIPPWCAIINLCKQKGVRVKLHGSKLIFIG